jgi:hypothetical protein
LQLNPGDVVRITTPLDREVGMVLTDVENGFVPAEEAADIYGVVLVEGAIDETATCARRSALLNQRSAEEFVFGPDRQGEPLLCIPERFIQRNVDQVRVSHGALQRRSIRANAAGGDRG